MGMFLFTALTLAHVVLSAAHSNLGLEELQSNHCNPGDQIVLPTTSQLDLKSCDDVPKQVEVITQPGEWSFLNALNGTQVSMKGTIMKLFGAIVR